MSKFGDFLKQTSEISNKDRLVVMTGTLILTGMGMYLNHALLKSRLKGLEKDELIANLDYEIHENKKELARLTYLENEYYNK